MEAVATVVSDQVLKEGFCVFRTGTSPNLCKPLSAVTSSSVNIQKGVL